MAIIKQINLYLYLYTYTLLQWKLNSIGTVYINSPSSVDRYKWRLRAKCFHKALRGTGAEDVEKYRQTYCSVVGARGVHTCTRTGSTFSIILYRDVLWQTTCCGDSSDRGPPATLNKSTILRPTWCIYTFNSRPTSPFIYIGRVRCLRNGQQVEIICI